ncbi:MAG: outer membrane beta-barrel protein [Bdellovibrionales bacterium]|nr:outer membrane beta-barrel protein [Bdellovibrionales bacterium]
MKKLSRFVAVLGLFSLVATEAHASGMSLVGGLNYGLNKFSNAAGEVKGGLGFGGGILLDMGIGGNGFEVGALYLSRKFNTTVLGVETSSSNGYIEIPAMIRFGTLTTFGVGAFYDIPMDSGYNSDFGLTAGVRLALGPKIFADARFNYGLKDNSGHSQNALLLLGLKL